MQLSESQKAKSSNRTIVVTFDRTGSDVYNTNARGMYFALKKDDTDKQIVKHVFRSRLHFTWTAKIKNVFSKDQELKLQLIEGYRWLMHNYNYGDKICIFGENAACAFAGMLYTVGLLPRGSERRVACAYRLFTDNTKRGLGKSALFKHIFSTDVNIDFVGVWHATSSVGFFPSVLPYTYSNPAIKVFRQALSLHERRVNFRPAIYCHDVENNSDNDVQEVWFAGCHNDVAGGAIPHCQYHSLACISLRWMICQSILANIGILFETEHLLYIGFYGTEEISSEAVKDRMPVTVDVASLKTLVGSTERLEVDEKSMLSPMHDCLHLENEKYYRLLGRWLLEIIPTRECVQLTSEIQKIRWIINGGHCRNAEQYAQLQKHWTADERMK